MIRLAENRVKRAATSRGKAYLSDLRNVARLENGYYYLKYADYAMLRAKYRPLAVKAVSYTVSRLPSTPLSDDEQAARKLACEGCKWYRRSRHDGHYCEACGCGDEKRAVLEIKIPNRRAKCPIDLWEKL